MLDKRITPLILTSQTENKKICSVFFGRRPLLSLMEVKKNRNKSLVGNALGQAYTPLLSKYAWVARDSGRLGPSPTGLGLASAAALSV